ncbi:GntR family transcriptional regulator [Blautia producta]|uniref:GntR family transcriptional regulator n=1 Tax=Blautia producta TaxID=33035 RepID=UPI0031B58175
MKKVVNTIRKQVYQILKEEICNGDFKPGQWLQESELAERFSVSRSPVREALHQLAFDGLVVEVSNKGVFVKEFTPKDIEEIFDLRVMLENYAIGQLQNHLDEKGKEKLLHLLSCLEKEYTNNHIKEYISIDTDLHESFVTLSGNTLLEMVYERIHILAQQFRIYSLSAQDRYQQSMLEHQIIVNSIIEGNTARAQETNRHHLQLAKEQILIYLEETQEK